jgi:hypothetical protein
MGRRKSFSVHELFHNLEIKHGLGGVLVLVMMKKSPMNYFVNSYTYSNNKLSEKYK